MNFFDLHCDTAYKMYLQKQGFQNNNLAVSAKTGKCFEKWVQTFAVWISEETENPYIFYKKVLEHLKQNLTKGVKPVFALEGGTVIDSIERIHELKQDQIKFITLTWNGENKLAGGVKTDKDLTGFGRRVIDKMNSLKMAVDLSHLNKKSFYSVIERADIVLATHSNCKAVCNVPRNLDDNQIKLIAQKGGVIGLNFYPLFLGGNTVQKIYENIYHLCDMGFENNIAIGTDFDGADMGDDITDVSKIPQIYTKLLEKGLEEQLLDKIFYKNAWEFLLRV